MRAVIMTAPARISARRWTSFSDSPRTNRICRRRLPNANGPCADRGDNLALKSFTRGEHPLKTVMSGLALLLATTAVSSPAATVTKKSEFGKMPDGTAFALYTLTNAKGMEAKIITRGGILVSLKTPDRK